ncbi:rho GTPase-activating protein 33-like [Centruroides sculpturatus]|uniref:rho GTPase-activating protein 33-like n=1 Tax=Centruroides sculpturatus TaxID=218467 RepID=UPI000C6CB405|nr:rho GTPase-activating protein 33-like [Centruroides sculpturatus]
MYFRELPNPLLTYQLYDKFVNAVQSEEEVRLLRLRDVVQQLPPPHYRTLEYLMLHLAKVAGHGGRTGMTPKNVAIVWAPNLLRSKDVEGGGVGALHVVGVQAVLTEYLIRYADLIFNEKLLTFQSPGPDESKK